MDNKINQKQVFDLIVYGLELHNLNAEEISLSQYNKIFKIHTKYSNLFDEFLTKTNGKLDTFQNAGCLMIAINKSEFFESKKANAIFALDIACKICQTPDNMMDLDFRQIFAKDKKYFNKVRRMIVEALMVDDYLSPFNCALSLRTIYETALKKYEDSLGKRKQFFIKNIINSLKKES